MSPFLSQRPHPPPQGIDTSGDNPAGRLQLGVLMAVAEFERSLIRERVLVEFEALDIYLLEVSPRNIAFRD